MYFRYLLPNGSNREKFLTFIHNYLPHYRNYSSINANTLIKYVDGYQFDQLAYSNPFKLFIMLAKNHGIIAITHNNFLLEFLQSDLITYRIGNATCTTLKNDKLKNVNHIWFIRLHFAKTVSHYLDIIKESGFRKKWQGVWSKFAFMSILDFKKHNLTRRELFKFREPKSLPLLESSLKNIFILHGSLCVLAFIYFIWEVKHEIKMVLRKIVKQLIPYYYLFRIK